MEKTGSCTNVVGFMLSDPKREVSDPHALDKARRLKFRRRFADEGFESFHSSDHSSDECVYFSGEALPPLRECKSISTSYEDSPQASEVHKQTIASNDSSVLVDKMDGK